MSTKSCQMALALRPFESPNSMVSRCGSQALGDGRQGGNSGAAGAPDSASESGVTALAGFAGSGSALTSAAGWAEPESGVTSLVGFGAPRPQAPGERRAM